MIRVGGKRYRFADRAAQELYDQAAACGALDIALRISEIKPVERQARLAALDEDGMAVLDELMRSAIVGERNTARARHEEDPTEARRARGAVQALHHASRLVRARLGALRSRRSGCTRAPRAQTSRKASKSPPSGRGGDPPGPSRGDADSSVCVASEKEVVNLDDSAGSAVLARPRSTTRGGVSGPRRRARGAR